MHNVVPLFGTNRGDCDGLPCNYCVITLKCTRYDFMREGNIHVMISLPSSKTKEGMIIPFHV